MRVLVGILFSIPICVIAQSQQEVIAVLKEHILSEASQALKELPVTVTSARSERSAGGKHDFYSEGDYWWPDTENPQGPYMQRDGMTNPDNFTAHRKAMVRFSRIIGALAAAYKITGDDIYVMHAILHLNAWFADTTTRMNPSLLYAQAIKGRYTGRGIGIIDTIHLMEVVQGIVVMEKSRSINREVLTKTRQWFKLYLQWLTTHQYGKDEMNAENNHGTCWVMQVAAFARFTANDTILSFCRDRYKNILLPNQMANDGSFPRELKRTKPYGYSLFNLDAMAMVCHILSDADHDLWHYKTADGKSIQKGIEFLYPYVNDKSKWPYQKDVMYWDNWPVAHPFLVLGAAVFKQRNWFNTWKRLDHNPSVEEVLRNLPVRNPVIWLEN